MPSNANTVVNKRPKRSRDRKRGDTTKGEISRFAGDAYDLGRRALKGVVYLKNLINIETKYHDSANVYYPSTTPAVAHITDIAQGLTSISRVGDSIKIQSLYYSGSLVRHASATNTFYRVLIVRDNERTSADPTMADVLQYTSGYFYMSQYNHRALQSNRFGILADWSGVLTASDPVAFQKFDIPHTGHIKYTGNNGSDNAEGSIFLLYESSEATNTPSLNFEFRITFTDD
jgi:hypothetical protein